MSNAIKIAFIDAGLTRVELARRCGISRQWLLCVLSGEWPGHESRPKIARHLGVTLEWLDAQIPTPGAADSCRPRSAKLRRPAA